MTRYSFLPLMFLTLFLLILPTTSKAGIGDDILACLANPCNCGCDDIVEDWRGREQNNEDGNCNCPPYLKGNRGGCLKQFAVPELFEMWYNKVCAEASPKTNYFDPQIRIRVQTCNAFCWTFTDNLSGDGECKIYPGFLGVPTMRICARMALPYDPIMKTPADEGYTPDVHLNWEGATVPDRTVPGVDGTPVKLIQPKICAYNDPSFIDTIQFMFLYGLPDFMDLDPTSQPAHHMAGITPFFKALIAFVKMGVSLVDAVKGLLEKIPEAIRYTLYWLESLRWMLYVSTIIGDKVFVTIFETIGQINRIVTGSLGCVEIPLGPMPPPYCSPLAMPPQHPTVYQICPTVIGAYNTSASSATTPLCNSAGNAIGKCIGVSSSANPCVYGALENNIIHNSVRLAFDNVVPICKDRDVPGDKCVQIKGSLLPSVVHAATISANPTKADIIYKCGSTSSGIACVDVTPCSGKHVPGWCSNTTGFRVVYASNLSGSLSINNYYDSTATDCIPTNNSKCQKVYGINIGNFKDVALAFPETETSYNTANLSSSQFSIVGSKGTSENFIATIPRQKITINGNEQFSDEICVYKANAPSDSAVGCVKRPIPPKPTVYGCTAPSLKATCSPASSHLLPKMVAKLQVGTYSTEGVVGPPTETQNGKINLAGFDYEGYATDNNFTTKPFSGARSINPTSIYGNYKDNLAPYDASGNLTNAIYLNGLEYTNDKYVIGGQKLCLSGYKFDDCLTSSNKQNCVLASLLYSDKMACSVFSANVTKAYPGIRLCSASDLTACTTPISSMRGIGNNTVTIKGCSNGSKCYTYTGAGTNMLCQMSYDAANRINPIPDLGAQLNDTQYFPYNPSLTSSQSVVNQANSMGGGGVTYSATAPNYDVSGVRNKTSVEHGLCVGVPLPPSCTAVNTAEATEPANKYATWTTAEAGALSTGACIAGATQIDPTKPLKRYCVVNKTTGASALETLSDDVGCRQGCKVDTDLRFSYLDSGHTLTLFDGGKSPGATTLYNYYFKFNVTDKNLVTALKIRSISFDDLVLVKLNGTKVYSGHLNNIDRLVIEGGNVRINNTQVVRGEHNGTRSFTINTNLIPYLVNGENELSISLVVAGGGSVFMNLEYNIPGCTSLTE